jgi:hypothetical protein
MKITKFGICYLKNPIWAFLIVIRDKKSELVSIFTIVSEYPGGTIWSL